MAKELGRDGAGVGLLPARRAGARARRGAAGGLGSVHADGRRRSARRSAPPRGPVFITVTGKKDPYVPKLDEVKDRVREDVIRVRAAELSRQRATEIAAALQVGAELRRRRQGAGARGQGHRAHRARLGAARHRRQRRGRQGGLRLPVGGVSEPITTSDGTVIVRVVERDEVTPEEFTQAQGDVPRRAAQRAPRALLLAPT